jgi:hypothetical protein
MSETKLSQTNSFEKIFSESEQKEAHFVENAAYESKSYIEDSLIKVIEEPKSDGLEEYYNQLSFKFDFLSNLFRTLEEISSRLAIVSCKVKMNDYSLDIAEVHDEEN